MKNFIRCLMGGLIALFVSVSAYAVPVNSQSELDGYNAALKDCSDQTITTLPSGAQKVVYVNGILVEDWFAAKQASDRMKVVLCSSNSDASTGVSGSHNHPNTPKTFVFQVVYNPIGWDSQLGGVKTATTAAQDAKELFQLKAGEEYYLPSDGNDGLACPVYLCDPHDNPHVYTSADSDGLLKVRMRADHPENSSREVNGGWSPSTGLETADSTLATQMTPTKSVVYKLTGIMKYSGSTIVVAHSQGNLIANLAYAYAKYDLATALPEYNADGTPSGDGIKDISRKVRIVNVANTAAISINNLSLKHEGDGVVKTLLGQMAPLAWWRSTPRADEITYSYHKAFYVDPSTMNTPVDTGTTEQLAAASAASADFDFAMGDLSALSDDLRSLIQNIKDSAGGYFRDHYMVETYLSDRLVSVKDNQLRGVVYTAPLQSFRDFFEDLVYTAVYSMEDTNAGWVVKYRSDFISGIDSSLWSFYNASWGPGQYNVWAPGYNAGAVRYNTEFRPDSGSGKVRIRWRQLVDGSGDGSWVVANGWLNIRSTSNSYDCRTSPAGMLVFVGYHPADRSPDCQVFDVTYQSTIGRWMNFELVQDQTSATLSFTFDGEAQKHTVTAAVPFGAVVSYPNWGASAGSSGPNLHLSNVQIATLN